MNKVLYEATFVWHSMYYDSCFVFAVTLLSFFHLRRRRFESDTQREIACFLVGIIAAFSFFFQIAMGVSAIKDYQQIILPYEKGAYRTVVGKVDNFVPMPYDGHRMESFKINGVYFEYSDFVVQQGYTTTKSHGGVITGNGQDLKIGYIRRDGKNYIVYIEAAGE